MKRILLLGILLTQLIFTQQAEITNVQVAQRTDGSKLVDITYDLSPDALFTDFNITVEISLDGGATWTQSFYVQGDVFAGQSSGDGKAIVWNMGQEYANTFNENVQVRVIAEGSIMGPPPFDMVSVPAGDYTYGSNDQTLNIDYDFEMSKYEITNAQYVAYLIEALEDGSVYISNDVYGFYTGDENYGPGNQRFYDLGDNTSNYNYGRINWNGTTFTVTDGYGDHPVVYVTWFGAQAFAQHYGMRLPTEYEWEKTARG
ncbi:MAG: SUMF1/EgtB/PvdO family nonheme iron enzyme, partial [Candidatus Marinimicrobia bacterium]|nr:SUMF1/EgtB/PvdO family nonheme iron enzyme [Candidatus Neomarinimicrobiota bacterium]